MRDSTEIQIQSARLASESRFLDRSPAPQSLATPTTYNSRDPISGRRSTTSSDGSKGFVEYLDRSAIASGDVLTPTLPSRQVGIGGYGLGRS